jgi:hypothetical protein
VTRAARPAPWLRAIAAFSFIVSAFAQAQGFRGDLRDYLGPQQQLNPFVAKAKPGTPAPHGGPLAALQGWNRIAIDASGLDHTPVAAGETRRFGEQLGPGRASRAMAVVHIAMFEAVNAVMPRYHSYIGIAPVSGEVSLEAAIAQAAHDALVAMFPSQAPAFDTALAQALAQVDGKRARQLGVDLGAHAAATTLAMRAGDGAELAEPHMDLDFIPQQGPGYWRQDPVSHSPIAMGAHWGEVRPFLLETPEQFRAPSPPAMESAEYAAAYDEAKAFGGDGIVTPTVRTPEQTEIGIFWAYDGTPSLCAPPRLYNQLTLHIAALRGTSNVVDLARLLALVNTAMADAGIAIWESKYYYQFWRPVGGIRESDPGTGPTGLGDGNAATLGDPLFMPLGAPASNLVGPNFTPPFPSYPSGHAGFGGAVFELLRRFYGTDDIAFDFVSDEFNGVTLDSSGNVRPVVTRHFSTLSQAEEENGQSRIYLGIHWSFDKTGGITQGRQVADYVFQHAFQPK